jgi:hypothetical protein
MSRAPFRGSTIGLVHGAAPGVPEIADESARTNRSGVSAAGRDTAVG